jgi:hypothetical protein
MKKTIGAAMLALALAACGPQTPPLPTVDANGNAVPQAQQQGIDGSSAVLGAAAGALGGYMLGKSSGRNEAYRNAPVIVQQRPVIVPRYSTPTYRTVPSYRSTPSYSRPSTVTRSVTRRR